uniref:Uncharacterized protein n=1 Tax=Ananas comosus var. bracteatus TaxID=296719 RepID=A0A6V7P1N8_ANACO|nr:unnamed protein product [Ananas comosus var. bracteatus]
MGTRDGLRARCLRTGRGRGGADGREKRQREWGLPDWGPAGQTADGMRIAGLGTGEADRGRQMEGGGKMADGGRGRRNEHPLRWIRPPVFVKCERVGRSMLICSKANRRQPADNHRPSGLTDQKVIHSPGCRNSDPNRKLVRRQAENRLTELGRARGGRRRPDGGKAGQG